jgi:hypothetical protein
MSVSAAAATGSRIVAPASVVAAASLVATRRTTAGVEVAGDHDADRLDPAGDVEHGIEPALGEDIVLLAIAAASRRFAARILDAQKLEALVVLLEASGDRCKVVPSAAGECR